MHFSKVIEGIKHIMVDKKFAVEEVAIDDYTVRTEEHGYKSLLYINDRPICFYSDSLIVTSNSNEIILFDPVILKSHVVDRLPENRTSSLSETLIFALEDKRVVCFLDESGDIKYARIISLNGDATEISVESLAGILAGKERV